MSDRQPDWSDYPQRIAELERRVAELERAEAYIKKLERRIHNQRVRLRQVETFAYMPAYKMKFRKRWMDLALKYLAELKALRKR